MKSKAQKNVVLEKGTKNQNKNQAKPINNKNGINKGLNSWKSEKDLNKRISKNNSQIQNSIQLIDNSQLSQYFHTMNRKPSKINKDGNLKQEVKIITSPKLTTQLSPKTQTQRFFKSKNTLMERQEQKLQKIIKQKDDKIEYLQRTNEQLSIKIQITCKQKEKLSQILQQFKSQKEILEKKLQKLKNVANQNKKLIRQKAQSFNNNGSQIMMLKAQLEELRLCKKQSLLCQIGINTQPQEEKNAIFTDETSQNFQSKIEVSNLQINQHIKLSSTHQVPFQYENMLSCLNNQPHSILTQIKHFFENKIKQKDQILHEKEQIIYNMQKQLNQLYQKLFNKQITKPTVDTNESLLLQIKVNQELKQLLDQQQKKSYSLKNQIWNYEREIQNLKRQIQIKNILHEADLERSFIYDKIGNYNKNNNQLHTIQSEIDMFKKKIAENQSKIKDLEDRNEQQQKIIRSLRQKKTKIVK